MTRRTLTPGCISREAQLHRQEQSGGLEVSRPLALGLCFMVPIYGTSFFGEKAILRRKLLKSQHAEFRRTEFRNPRVLVVAFLLLSPYCISHNEPNRSVKATKVEDIVLPVTEPPPEFTLAQLLRIMQLTLTAVI